MISRPKSRSCRTASIRSGIAGGLAGELWVPAFAGTTVTWRLNSVSLVLKVRLTLLHERGHAFLLVMRREQRVKHAALESHAFGERGLESAIDGLLRRQH